MRATLSTLFILSLANGLSACSEAEGPTLPRVSVPASLETAAVAGAGDAADDPAFWRAQAPAQSRILGTDKKSGLYVYTLDGGTAQYLPAGRMNNVDVRYGFEAGAQTVDIAVASDRGSRFEASTGPESLKSLTREVLRASCTLIKTFPRSNLYPQV